MPDNTALAALGTAPIPGASPTGASVKYEPEFEQLVAEIGKLESIEGRGTIKWGEVVELSTAILGGKSKDLLVASYLTLGLLQQEGYAGLAGGLEAVKGLLATHWEGLFPEKTRMRARQAALQWMGDRVADALTALGDAAESDRESLAAAERLVEEITAFARDNFGETLPDLSNLARLVGEKHASVPAPAAPEPEPAAAETTAAPAPGAAAAPAAPRAIDTPDAAREALKTQREQRLRAAQVLREAAPTDPLPYRLMRETAWEDLVDLPPHKDGLLEGWVGDPALAAALEEKLAKGDFAAVAAEAESKLPQERFWLDLNFFSVRALEGLGRPYAAARNAVAQAVASLLRRLPDLLEMKFSDGAPLASDATKLWIRTEAGGEKAPAAGAGGAVEAALAEARTLVARNAFGEATELMLKQYRGLASRRDRFRCRLALAGLCLEGGRGDLALPQLEGLDEEARKVGLEDWEPEIAAELARALWTCYRGSSTPERGEAHFTRLCRLDPAAALGGSTTKKG